MSFLFGMAVGAVSLTVFLVILYKVIPDKESVSRQKKHLELVERQLKVFNERMVEELRLADAIEQVVTKLPTRL